MSTAKIIEAVRGIKVVSYVDVASVTMFTYDYLITLGLEVDLVWKSKWNWVKVLYLIQRYMPFFDVGFLTLFDKWQPGTTPAECRRMTFAIGFLYLAGMSISEAILSIRVWALWNRDSRMKILLPIAFICTMTPCFVLMYYFSNSIVYAKVPYPGFLGCFPVSAKRYVIWCWAIFLVWNTGILLLMLIPGFRSYRIGILGMQSNLNSIVYRDGILYYIYLFMFSIINIAITTTQPAETRSMLTGMERCLHSMFASRVLLHMRDHGRASKDPDALTSRVQFNSMEGVGYTDTMVLDTRGYPTVL